METLNKGQVKAMKVLKSGKNVFLSGEAGTGKSYVLNQFIKESRKKNILVCAPTGIAAINVHGSTLHRVFKVPIEPISPWKNPIKTSDAVQEADIIIIDEISMCRFDCFEYVAKAIRLAEREMQSKINKKAAVMGVTPNKTATKQLIVVGDFFQLPPVITEKDRTVLEKYWGKEFNVGDGFAFQAPMWNDFDFVTIVLDEVMRQKNLDFVTNLNKVRCGDGTALAWFNEKAAKQKQKGIYLCTTNKAAASLNAVEAGRLKGKSKIYRASISGTVTPSDKMTDDELELKVGMQVMSLVNDPNNRYQNGSIGTVKSLGVRSATVQFDELVEMEPFRWEIIDYKIIETEDKSKNKVEKVVTGSFEQIPLKIAYAITIHKSQGQTYDAANVEPACFAPGQLYVALSRIKTVKKLHLEAKIKPQNLITSQIVLNFYKHGITQYDPIDFVTETTSLKENITEAESSVVTEKKDGRGGHRKGAGRRRKYGEGVETCTIRIPKSAKDAVLEFLTSREWD